MSQTQQETFFAEEGKESKEAEPGNKKKTVDKAHTNLSLTATAESNYVAYNKSEKQFLTMASITAPFYFNENSHAPIDLICIIDESGSMSGGRIQLVKETVAYIIDNLGESDQFGLVGYSNKARILLPLTNMSKNNKIKAQAITSKLNGSGSTALFDGLKTGINMMKTRLVKNDIATVMLLTDGHANVGITNVDSMIATLQGKAPAVKYVYQSNSSQMNKKPGDWNCSNCNYLNFASRDSCNSCSIGKRPKGHKGRPGDWNCPKCNDLNFGRRNKCRQCGTKRPKNESNKKENKKEKKEKKENKNIKNESKEDDFNLGCVINTFGFGSDHNEKLLEKLSEFGNGMYAYIENGDMVADTFGECLGGLVSTLAVDVKLKIDALQTVKIFKCLSKGFKCIELKKHKSLQINLNDIQSEEIKYLLFDINIPKIKQSEKEYNTMRFTLNYTNTILDKKQEQIYVLKINRDENNNDDNQNKDNIIKLNEQKNRISVSDAMQKAYELGQNNELEKGKQLLNNVKLDLSKSISKDTEYTKSLMNDIDDLLKNSMKNDQVFKAKGSKILKMNNKAHLLQRSVQASNFASQSKYENQSKKYMKHKFMKGDWKCKECSYHNFSRYNKCNKCGKGLRPRKKGDWDCSSCNTLNFASRSVCYQCGTQKK